MQSVSDRMRSWLGLASLVLCSSLGLAQGPTQIGFMNLGIADCDGVAIGSPSDAYLACHSPYDRLSIEVQGSKQESDAMDAYILRLNLQTGKLVYATRIGGSDYDEAGRIRVDGAGFAYAVGFTKSQDFPTSPDGASALIEEEAIAICWRGWTSETACWLLRA